MSGYRRNDKFRINRALHRDQQRSVHCCCAGQNMCMGLEGCRNVARQKANDKSSTPCRYGPICADNYCPYGHPKEADRDPTHCTCDNSRCMKTHPQRADIVCKFEADNDFTLCKRKLCEYDHPNLYNT